MSLHVVDASAIAALLFNEAEGEPMGDALIGRTLAAPVLIDFELAHVCQKKMQAQPEQSSSLRAAFRTLPGLSIERMEVDHPEVIDLAEERRISTYDASYLWLALALEAPLITLDVRLRRAFER